MKYIGFFALLLGLSAHAQNPLIRVCLVTEGEFHVYDFPNTSDYAADQYAFCQYEGTSAIDAISLFQVTGNLGKTMAVLAFEETLKTPALTCGDASYQIGTDQDEKRIEVCMFEDRSLIELNTLKLGYNADENENLVRAVETRF